MNLKPYDILSSLIPGIIILFIFIPVLGFTYDEHHIIAYTALAFTAGCFLNIISSLLEGFYFWTWRGKPSTMLLDGKGMRKIKLYNHAAIKQHLISKAGKSNASNNELFGIAMRYAFSQKDARLEDFSNNYAFSRTMLTCSVISSIGAISKYYYDWRVFLSLVVVILFWYRAKQRGYYFSREVLQVYSKNEQL